MNVNVFKIPQSSPDDLSGLEQLIQSGAIAPASIVAILGKTEGNGCVNDFTRGFATQTLKTYLKQYLEPEAVQAIVFVMSGGTEGILSPHLNVFIRQPNTSDATRLGLVMGTARTRPFLPKEIGTVTMVDAVAKAVAVAIAQSEAELENIHFVQIKCPLVTAHRSHQPSRKLSSYESMALSRGASALGVAVALGELDLETLTDAEICNRYDYYSSVASASAGIELQNCEIFVLGNAPTSTSSCIIGHSVMQHALDISAVNAAIAQVGNYRRIVNVFAKAEADPSGLILNRRHTMLDDSDISHTRMARAVVGSAIASVVQDPMIYVSGGSEHQGPPGGGPVAVIVDRV